MLDEDQKEMLETGIKQVRLTDSDKCLENYAQERRVENFINLSMKVIKDMENSRDPDFLRALHYAQQCLTREDKFNLIKIRKQTVHLGAVGGQWKRLRPFRIIGFEFRQSVLVNLTVPLFPTPQEKTLARHLFAEFLSIQIEAFATCNRIAMRRCTRGPVDKIAHRSILEDPEP